MMNLPVTLVGIGAGYAYGDAGPTHHAVQDLSILRAIPKMMILNASDTVSLSNFCRIAYENTGGPLYVRFDKANIPQIYTDETKFSEGLARIRNGRDLTIISTGLMVHRALEIANALNLYGIKTEVIDIYRIKPINCSLLANILANCEKIITLEEHGPIGGLGSLISEFLCDYRLHIPLKRIALEDSNCFIYGTRDYVHREMGLDKDNLTANIYEWSRNL